MSYYRLERMTLCEKDKADCPDDLWHKPLYKVVTKHGRVIDDLLTEGQGVATIEDLEFNASVFDEL